MTLPPDRPARGYGTIFNGMVFNGMVFNEIAAEYDRHRPGYPDELIDQACRAAGIGSGDRVLEVGCGSGQLTRSLVARGLRVTALEPGTELLSMARQNLAGLGQVEFVNARFEDARFEKARWAGGRFRAVFSASAFHWVDPEVGWQRAADLLVPGGTLALVQYFGLEEPRSKGDQDAALAAIRTVAPDIAAGWPVYRDLDATLAGIHARRGNISQAWSWLGSYDLARQDTGRLFGEVQAAVMPRLTEYTPDELGALVRTMSFYARLSPDQRRALDREHEAIHARLGRPIRASTIAIALTARRRADPAGPNGAP